MAYTVFISYEKSDKDVADKVCSAIESRTIGSRKIQCWIAPRDVPIGIPYRKAIVQAIREVQLMVLVLSSAANDSLHVINEVEEAHSKGITIVPLVVEDVTLDDRLEFCIAGINWLDATDKPLEACLEQLGDSIERLVSRLKPKPERESEEEPETPPKPVPPKPKPPKEGEMLLSNVKAFFKEYDWKFKEVPEETTLRTGFKGKSRESPVAGIALPEHTRTKTYSSSILF